jgi:hypothetical protein
LTLPGSSSSWQAAAEVAWKIADKTSIELADVEESSHH